MLKSADLAQCRTRYNRCTLKDINIFARQWDCYSRGRAAFTDCMVTLAVPDEGAVGDGGIAFDAKTADAVDAAANVSTKRISDFLCGA